MEYPQGHSKKKKSTGCKIVAMGCGAIVLIGLIGLVLLALNIDKIKSSRWFNNLGSLFTLQQEVLKEFPSDTVHIKMSMNAKEGEGRPLTVQLTNPAFLQEPDVDREGKAREVARFVLESYELAEDVSIVHVGIRTGTTGTVTVTTGRTYTFTRAELLGHEEEEIDGPVAEPVAIE